MPQPRLGRLVCYLLLVFLDCRLADGRSSKNIHRFDMRSLTDFQTASHRLQRTATSQLNLHNHSKPGDNFGASLALLGDFDNDNNSEFAVTSLDPATNTGYLNIITLVSTQNLRHVATHRLPSEYFASLDKPVPPSRMACDLSLALVGHTTFSPETSNSSRLFRLAIGTPCLASTGAVFIHSFGGSGEMLDHNPEPLMLFGLASGAQFGASIAHIGDIDGDGNNDIIVGAPGHSSLYTIFLDEKSRMVSFVRTHTKELNHKSFGSAIASLGDVNADGKMEILVACSKSIHLLSLTSTGHVNVSITLKLPSRARKALHRKPALSLIGLDDNDGIAFAIGNRFDNEDGFQKGAIWITTITTKGSVIRCVKLSANEGNLDGHLERGDHFGASLTTAFDLNKDGSPELLVGVPKSRARPFPTFFPSVTQPPWKRKQADLPKELQFSPSDTRDKPGALWVLNIPGTRSLRVTKLEEISPRARCVFTPTMCTCLFRYHHKSTCLTFARIDDANQSYCYERNCSSSFECGMLKLSILQSICSGHCAETLY